jgi:predicted glycoside hydrolase/deacetylase ChbG (UPF0249 family)
LEPSFSPHETFFLFQMIVCADDFGFGDDIDGAILELCASGRLSAVSCATPLQRCSPQMLKQLRACEGQVDIGMHLCLADETLQLANSAARGLGLPKYRLFLRRAILGQVKPRDVAAKVSAQYVQFVEKCGRRPDFIDGHLHVHQLPGVRAGLIEFVLSLPAEGRPYIRNTRLRLRKLWKRRLPWLKAASIGAFGARMLAELRAAGLATNQGFAGVYNFRDWRRYPQYLPRFVQCLDNPNGILVVHPGNNAEWRRQELEALRGFTFPSGTPTRFRRNI